MKKVILSLLIATVLSAVFAPATQAVSGNDFQPGRIIDDSIFYNKNAMSVSQIQQFLDSKVSCDRNGTETSELGGGTRAQYGAAHGNPAPYTCLNGYYENIDTHVNNLEGRPIPSGARSAAQIIWDAAQAHTINPQVLIVLLQKEQGLVTDEWPFPVQYRSATGYGCPDTAPCDDEYYGFYNQVHMAAYQFRRYANTPNSFNHIAGQFNNIRWSPNASCGTSSVYIQNTATAGLYNYTPYRPNQAALNNLYGTGDGCSAYGNRNWWRYFNDWFGSTTGVRFASEFRGWSSYPTVKAGEQADGFFFYKNTGGATWSDLSAYDGGLPPITLAATSPINRASRFSATWVSSSRPAVNFSAVYESDGVTLASNQHKASPGQIVVFAFKFTVPADTPPGVYREFFQPVAEGAPDWHMGSVGYLDVTVTPADHAAQVYRILGNPVPRMERGSSTPVAADFKNVGTQPWYDDVSVPSGKKPVHLAHTAPINRFSHFPSAGWGNPSRPALTFAAVYEADGRTLAANQHIAHPGQIARFHYYYTAPAWYPSGTYREFIQPVVEGAPDWDMGAVSPIDVTVYGNTDKAKFYRFSGYPTITRGSSATVYIDYQNIGTQTWYDTTVNPHGALNLANTMPINRSNSLMWDSGWTSRSRPQTTFTAVYEQDGSTLAGNQHMAYPGQIVRFSYKYSPPSNMQPGVYQEWVQPVREGFPAWDVGAGGYFQVTVQ
jgi:hypothetical protein